MSLEKSLFNFNPLLLKPFSMTSALQEHSLLTPALMPSWFKWRKSNLEDSQMEDELHQRRNGSSNATKRREEERTREVHEKKSIRFWLLCILLM